MTTKTQKTTLIWKRGLKYIFHCNEWRWFHKKSKKKSALKFFNQKETFFGLLRKIFFVVLQMLRFRIWMSTNKLNFIYWHQIFRRPSREEHVKYSFLAKTFSKKALWIKRLYLTLAAENVCKFTISKTVSLVRANKKWQKILSQTYKICGHWKCSLHKCQAVFWMACWCASLLR